MANPLYVRGMAVEGKDSMFHWLDGHMESTGDTELLETTGARAAEVMKGMALKGQGEGLRCPIPFECEDKINVHARMCGKGCNHDKHCGSNLSMWLSLDQQLKTPYAGHLSDALAAHLLKFYKADIEQLRTALTEKLQSHGDILLKKWKKMSRDKRGHLLSQTSPDMFGNWPLEVRLCSESDCYEEHHYQWIPGSWVNSRSLSEDW